MATAALKHDKDGFLVGEAVAIDKAAQARSMSILSAIRDDTRAILKAVNGEAAALSKMAKAVTATPVRQSSTGRNLPARDALGRFMRAETPEARKMPNRAQPVSTEQAIQAAVARMTGGDTSQSKPAGAVAPSVAGADLTKLKAAERAALPTRDTSGRFVAGNKPKDDGSEEDETKEKDRSSTALADAAESIKNSASQLAEGTEEVDPNIKAGREIAELASLALSPLSKMGKAVWNRLFGRKDEDAKKTVPWFKRIFRELRGIRMIGAVGDVLSYVGMRRKPGAAGEATPANAVPVTSAEQQPGMFGRARARFSSFFRAGREQVQQSKKSLEWQKRIWTELRKLGKAKQGGGAGGGILDFLKNLIPNPANLIGSIVRGLGGILGGLIPTIAGVFAKGLPMMLPALAVAASGALGYLFGKWLYDKFAPQILDAIEGVANFMEETWKGAISLWESAVSKVSELIEGAVNFAKDVKDKAAGVYDAARTATSDGIEATVNAAKSTWEGAKELVGLGSLSAKHEGKPGTVAMDNNGAYAYGKYQFNSGNGGLKTFFDAASEYKGHFAGLAVGSEAFNAKWKELAKSDPNFEAAQDRAARQKFYAPMEPLARSAGFKMDDRGVQEALFSASINHSPKGNQAIYAMASRTPGFADMKPADQIKALYAARKSYVQSVDIDGGQKVKDALLKRYDTEQRDALSISAGSQAANVSIPLAPSWAPNASIATEKFMPAPAPVKQQTLNSPQSKPEKSVILLRDKAGQNVSDRSIAQLATGGMGGYGG